MAYSIFTNPTETRTSLMLFLEKIGATDQWVWLHGAGRSFFVWPFVSRLAWAGWPRAGWRQMEELGLVLLGRGPRERVPHPLHWVLPHCLLTMCLCQENSLITYVYNGYISIEEMIYCRHRLSVGWAKAAQERLKKEISDFKFLLWHLYCYVPCF